MTERWRCCRWYRICYRTPTDLSQTKLYLEKAGYTLDDIKSFDDLKKVADDIQARKDEIGVKGAFTSAGMDGSSDWRFKTHLANLPIYYEYKADGIDDTEAIKGTYLDQYKNVFDLYITDSTCDGSELSAKTADDSRNEFVNGDAVFYQNGSWEYAELAKTYSDDELAMIPIYFGVDDAGNVLGIPQSQVDKLLNTISIVTRQGFRPAADALVRTRVHEIKGRYVVVATVLAGTDLPYYATIKGGRL